jgi:hypothetical protein
MTGIHTKIVIPVYNKVVSKSIITKLLSFLLLTVGTYKRESVK